MSLEASWMLYNCDEALFLWTIKHAGALSLLRSIPDHYRWVFLVNHMHVAAGWWPPISSRCPATTLRGNLKVGIMPSAMINLLLAVKALEGRNSTSQSPQWSNPPVPPLLLLSHSRLLFVPSEQSGEQSCIAVWFVELCGYANVSRLVGILLNGWAEEVNKRVWMRGGGQRVKEMK